MGKRDFTQNRSDKYQYAIVEIAADLQSLDFRDLLEKRPMWTSANIRARAIREEIEDRLFELMRKHLSETQMAVIDLYLLGLTQSEIARFMDRNQSSICKSIYGNTTYVNGIARKFGGSIKKMKKVIARDKRMQELFAEYSEITE